ncbi:MAG: hypothetical protein ACI9ON_000199 [Limisphaerales bacterium]|jgi:hypothetical protein
MSLSFEKRRTATVIGVINDLVAGGKSALRPGDVNSVLRDRDMPMGSWEVRAEFSRLERDGLLRCDADSGDWFLIENASVKDTG